jgi:hypothetical protein
MLTNNLKKGERVKLIFESGIQVLEVLEADENGFSVNTTETGKVFVYGREVNDFHTVDYEALSTLNISATQELYKRMVEAEERSRKLEAELQQQKGQMQEFAKQLEEIRATMSIQAEVKK